MFAPNTFYLDQCVLSGARAGQKTRETLFPVLKQLQERGAKLVYSMTLVEECWASDRPESFVEILEELSAYLMFFENASEARMTLAPRKGARPSPATCRRD